MWAESGAHLSCTHFLCLQLSSPKDSAFQRSLLKRFTVPLWAGNQRICESKLIL